MIAFRKGSSLGLQNLNSLPLHLNIKKLKLKRISLPWSEINIIGMLPNLEVLKLKEVSDDSNWEGADGSFSKLTFLFIEARYLICWKLNEEVEQFPCLERLVLKRCTSLEALPTGFEDILTLKSIMLKNCSPSVFESANAINASWEDFGYDPILIRQVDQIEEGDEDDEEEDDDADDVSPE